MLVKFKQNTDVFFSLRTVDNKNKIILCITSLKYFKISMNLSNIFNSFRNKFEISKK